jgi:hypothetical protein
MRNKISLNAHEKTKFHITDRTDASWHLSLLNHKTSSTMSEVDFDRYRSDENSFCSVTSRALQRARRSAARNITKTTKNSKTASKRSQVSKVVHDNTVMDQAFQERNGKRSEVSLSYSDYHASTSI